jgi:hypothetical protein
MIVDGRYIEDGKEGTGAFKSPINGDEESYDAVLQESEWIGDVTSNMAYYDGNDDYTMYRNDGNGSSLYNGVIVRLKRVDELFKPKE